MKLKDKKIRIIELFTGKSPNGFPVKEWRTTHKGKLWAYYRQLSGSEFFASAKDNLKEDVIFVVNWNENITTDMFVEYNSKYYDIIRIDDFEGYKEDIKLFCKLSTDQNIVVIEGS